MKYFNLKLAFLTKFDKRLVLEKKKKGMWVCIVTSKYIRGEISFSKLAKKQGALNAWRGIALAAEIITKGVRMTVYNG